jgi:hypothetical protein
VQDAFHARIKAFCAKFRPFLPFQYLRQIAKMGKNGAKAKNQLIDFIELSKRYFCPKWLKTQIGEGIVINAFYRLRFKREQL